MSEPEAINVLDALREDTAKIHRASSDLYRAMLEGERE